MSLFLIFALLLVGEYYYSQYKEINQYGGVISILGIVLYSSSGQDEKYTNNQNLTKHQAIPKNRVIVNNQPLQTRFSCPPRKEKSVKYNRKNTLYQWTDENGRLVLTDKPPVQSSDHSVINDFKISEYDLSNQYFDLNIDFKYSGSYYLLKDDLNNSIRNIYLIISKLLGKDRLRLSTVNLRIFGDEARYQSFRRKTIPNGTENAAGFYLHGNGVNLAVTYSHPNPKDTVSVSLHESFHVMAYELFANTPRWFNEGMAEYLETMTIIDSVATIHSQNSWFYQLRSGLKTKGMPLIKLVTMTPNEFYGENKSFNYASSWSLITYLMHDKKGRKFLSKYMQALFDNYCKRVSTVPFIENNYPGGIRALENGWHEWAINGSQMSQDWTF